ncbi:MAG TPA: hypothetical protein DCM05_05115 [Elusimicrobia bacterium]|nr:hypothetical protein [Elusimicrobiota bacterium]
MKKRRRSFWHDPKGDLFLRVPAFLIVVFLFYGMTHDLLLRPLAGVIRERLERPAQARTLAAAEASRLPPPKRFDRITGYSASTGFLIHIVTPGQSESVDYPRPEFLPDGSLVLRQPKTIPIGKGFEVAGTGVRNVHGAHRLETCLDLAASKLKARNTRLSWADQVDWEGRYALVAYFHPGPMTLTCSSGPGRLEVPPATRRLCLFLSRAGEKLSAHAAMDADEERLLCETSGPPAPRPSKQVELTLMLARPPESRPDKPFVSTAQDEYRFSKFQLVCEDPAGCKARAD